MNLKTRLAKLETAARAGRLVVVFRDAGEKETDAIARWQSEHPGQTLNDADLRVTIVRWAA